jgi:hypothetical protein
MYPTNRHAVLSTLIITTDSSVYLIKLTTCMTSRQGTLYTPPKLLIRMLVYPGVRFWPPLQFVFAVGIMRLMTVRYHRLFIQLLIRKITFLIVLFNTTGSASITFFHMVHNFIISWKGDIFSNVWQDGFNSTIRIDRIAYLTSLSVGCNFDHCSCHSSIKSLSNTSGTFTKMYLDVRVTRFSSN